MSFSLADGGEEVRGSPLLRMCSRHCWKGCPTPTAEYGKVKAALGIQ